MARLKGLHEEKVAGGIEQVIKDKDEEVDEAARYAWLKKREIDDLDRQVQRDDIRHVGISHFVEGRFGADLELDVFGNSTIGSHWPPTSKILKAAAREHVRFEILAQRILSPRLGEIPIAEAPRLGQTHRVQAERAPADEQGHPLTSDDVPARVFDDTKPD
ncbi:hypothetical protein F5Y10DRAFT_266830 [Nemania abortiva]|nr:hypothetical protein F5Y10DRAFT_266830 [Nemania abortiva]